MRFIRDCLFPAILLTVPASAQSQIPDPAETASLMFTALREGDAAAVDTLVSSEAMEIVDGMLESLEQSLRASREATMLRISQAGYTATADEIGDWDASDYLRATVSLPIMMARFSPYSMEVVSSTVEDDEAVVQLVFSTAGGFELPSEARLLWEEDAWRVSSFMGLNSFP